MGPLLPCLALQQHRGEGSTGGHGEGAGVGVEDLEADVVGAGLQVGRHPLSDRFRAPQATTASTNRSLPPSASSSGRNPARSQART